MRGEERRKTNVEKQAALWQERRVGNCPCLWIHVIGQNTKSDN